MLNLKVLTAKANIGDQVRNKQDEILGRVTDILFDNNKLEVSFVVMSFEGKDFAIPYSKLKFIGEKGYFLLDIPYSYFSDASDGFYFQGKFYFRYEY